MTIGFQITPAENIAPAQVVTSPPEIYANWTAGTYNTGDRRLRGETVYECQSDGVTSDPLIGVGTSPQEWIVFGPSQKTAPFDGKTSTYATREDDTNLVFRVTPAPFFTNVYLAGVTGSAVTFTQYDAGGAVKQTSSPTVLEFDGHNTPWTVLFAPWEVRTSFGFGPLVPLIGDVEVSIEPTAGVASVGEIIIGRSRVLGMTAPDVDRRFIDNSTYDTDDFGDVEITQRRGVPERRFRLTLDTKAVPAAERILAENTGARCAFVPNEYTPDLITVGYLSDWRFRERVMWDEATGERVGDAVLEIQTRGIK